MKVLYLIAENQEKLWLKQDFAQTFRESSTSRNAAEHFHYIRSQKGEKIAVIDRYDRILGWIGLIPGADRAGRYYTISGHEVRGECRGQGIGTRLLAEAREYAQYLGVSRLKFGTSPLWTINSWLYITRLGSRYTWVNRIKLADGTPWPYVSGEWEPENPQRKPAELPGLDVQRLSVLDWKGFRPVRREPLPRGRAITVLLPPLTAEQVRKAAEVVQGFLRILFDLFETLSRLGYGFIWFDRLEHREEIMYFYYMTKELNLFAF